MHIMDTSLLDCISNELESVLFIQKRFPRHHHRRKHNQWYDLELYCNEVDINKKLDAIKQEHWNGKEEIEELLTNSDAVNLRCTYGSILYGMYKNRILFYLTCLNQYSYCDSPTFNIDDAIKIIWPYIDGQLRIEIMAKLLSATEINND